MSPHDASVLHVENDVNHMHIGSVAILSYAGELSFAVSGGDDSVPDIDVLRHGIEEGLEELRKLSGLREGGGGLPPPDAPA